MKFQILKQSNKTLARIGLIKNNEMLGLRLASLHNLWILAELMRRIRQNLE